MTSGTGPFEWTFNTTLDGQFMGGTAYKLSSEIAWRRCRDGFGETFRVSDLPEGHYTLWVTDDYNRNALGKHIFDLR